MDIEIRKSCAAIDWECVRALLKKAGMACFKSDLHRKAFENSYITVFVYHTTRLIGIGRAICDGAYQAAVYDVAVSPEYQGKGIGKRIMETILNELPQCNIILYASPGKEAFYEKHNFRKMKTGMACFLDGEKMKDRGFTA